MAFGPGKYDALCTQVREQAEASGAIVLVIDGKQGSGFSAQLPLALTNSRAIVRMLRDVADQIEEGGVGVPGVKGRADS